MDKNIIENVKELSKMEQPKNNNSKIDKAYTEYLINEERITEITEELSKTTDGSKRVQLINELNISMESNTKYKDKIQEEARLNNSNDAEKNILKIQKAITDQLQDKKIELEMKISDQVEVMKRISTNKKFLSKLHKGTEKYIALTEQNSSKLKEKIDIIKESNLLREEIKDLENLSITTKGFDYSKDSIKNLNAFIKKYDNEKEAQKESRKEDILNSWELAHKKDKARENQKADAEWMPKLNDKEKQEYLNDEDQKEEDKNRTITITARDYYEPHDFNEFIEKQYENLYGEEISEEMLKQFKYISPVIMSKCKNKEEFEQYLDALESKDYENYPMPFKVVIDKTEKMDKSKYNSRKIRKAEKELKKMARMHDGVDGIDIIEDEKEKWPLKKRILLYFGIGTLALGTGAIAYTVYNNMSESLKETNSEFNEKLATNSWKEDLKPDKTIEVNGKEYTYAKEELEVNRIDIPRIIYGAGQLAEAEKVGLVKLDEKTKEAINKIDELNSKDVETIMNALKNSNYMIGETEKNFNPYGILTKEQSEIVIAKMQDNLVEKGENTYEAAELSRGINTNILKKYKINLEKQEIKEKINQTNEISK